MDKLHEKYITELNGKQFADDGDKSLFTVGEPLPRTKLEFRVVLDNPTSIRDFHRKLESPDLGGDDKPKESDKKRSHGFSRSKTYKVAINSVGVIPIDAGDRILIFIKILSFFKRQSEMLYSNRMRPNSKPGDNGAQMGTWFAGVVF
ncbi:Uncharacterized protein Fot_18256 [Forsythia ovata]|uniref:Uncharacterized protein n=1 Tax=Forsythia ovata TaxID=205694 RepID=A0ABD1VHN9_9LAMI